MRIVTSALILFFVSSMMLLGEQTAKQPQKDSAPPAAKAAKKTPKKAPQETSVDLSAAFMFMQPDTVVLSAGDLKLTWKEFKPTAMRLMPKGKAQVDNNTLARQIRLLFQNMATRGLLLQEARSMNIEVSEEEKISYEAELEKSLKGNSQGLTKEKYIRSMNKKSSTLQKLSYPDTLKLIKLDKIKFDKIELKQDELDFYLSYMKTVNQSLAAKNDNMRKNIQSLFKDPTINTDKGFAELAKEFSEGTEATWGGELQMDFTRQELADVNEMKSFDYKVGETTPLIETSTAFRIMRVLRTVPQEDNNAPEKIRVAQMLFTKLQMEDLSKLDEIKLELTAKKKKQAIQDFAIELTKKYPVSSPLFPEGLWTKKNK